MQYPPNFPDLTGQRCNPVKGTAPLPLEPLENQGIPLPLRQRSSDFSQVLSRLVSKPFEAADAAQKQSIGHADQEASEGEIAGPEDECAQQIEEQLPHDCTGTESIGQQRDTSVSMQATPQKMLPETGESTEGASTVSIPNQTPSSKANPTEPVLDDQRLPSLTVYRADQSASEDQSVRLARAAPLAHTDEDTGKTQLQASGDLAKERSGKNREAPDPTVMSETFVSLDETNTQHAVLTSPQSSNVNAHLQLDGQQWGTLVAERETAKVEHADKRHQPVPNQLQVQPPAFEQTAEDAKQTSLRPSYQVAVSSQTADQTSPPPQNLITHKHKNVHATETQTFEDSLYPKPEAELAQNTRSEDKTQSHLSLAVGHGPAPNRSDPSASDAATMQDVSEPLPNSKSEALQRLTIAHTPATPQETRPAPASFLQNITSAVVTLRESGGQVDVSLSPKELGRLSLKLEQNGHMPTLTLSAERPETQDLIRRHFETLQEQLKQMGFGELAFSFNEQKNAHASAPRGDLKQEADSLSADDEESQTITRIPLETGLDIRI